MFRNNNTAVKQQQDVQMMAMMEDMQVRDSMRMYNSLVEKCFMQCVNNFSKKRLDSKEEVCIFRCTDKFLKHSNRIGQRFAELSNTDLTSQQSD